MGILVVTWNFPPRRGGIEYLISSICAGLKKHHTVFVVTAHSIAENSPAERIFRPRWPGLFIFFLYALAQGALLLYRNPRISIILGGSALVTPIVVVLARLFGRKAVVQTHGLDLIYPSMLYQLLCVRWVKFCDRVIANSHYTATVAEENGTRAGLVAVLPPGVDWERFSSLVCVEPVKKELRLAGKRILLFVGRLARRKGVEEFIKRSLPQIVQAVPDVCFVVVGHNPTDSLTHRADVLSTLEETIAELGLENHVRLLGQLDDDRLADICQAADLMILPALPMQHDVEGFGLVLLEAAAAGIPAVATRVGGIPDAIEHNKSGILVDPNNYEELSLAAIGLLTDEEKRRRMGAYARQRVKEKFSWGKIIARYESVLSDVIARKV
jgi:phosphatidyl-myo-inositol dimannoside synthase